MIILASKSPRRQELLKKIFPDFVVRVSDADETTLGLQPEKETINIALQKASSVQYDFDDIVIGADTIVYFDNKFIGKPKDFDDAVNILTFLSGNVHEVYTGFVVLNKGNVYSDYDRSTVKFKKLSKQEIIDYVTLNKPFDKAGAYGVQDGVTVESYQGSLDNIKGLPTEKLFELLKNNDLI